MLNIRYVFDKKIYTFFNFYFHLYRPLSSNNNNKTFVAAVLTNSTCKVPVFISNWKDERRKLKLHYCYFFQKTEGSRKVFSLSPSQLFEKEYLTRLAKWSKNCHTNQNAFALWIEKVRKECVVIFRYKISPSSWCSFTREITWIITSM